MAGFFGRKSSRAAKAPEPDPVRPQSQTVLGPQIGKAGSSLAFFGVANTGKDADGADIDDELPTRGDTMAGNDGGMANARAKAIAAKKAAVENGETGADGAYEIPPELEAFVCNECSKSFDGVEDGDFDFDADLSQYDDYPWYCNECWEAEFDLHERYPIDIKVFVEKRAKPNKHYIYGLNVTWDDGSEAVVYRKYSDLFDLHNKLMKAFPTAAGGADAGRGGGRLLPYLPGRSKLGNLKNGKIVKASASLIEQYLSVLCKLVPPAFPSGTHVGRSYMFAVFCYGTEDDFATPPAKPDPTTATNVGDEVEEEDIEDEQYIAVADFEAVSDTNGEMSFKTNDILTVIEKNDSGWWFCQKEDEAAEGQGEGWVPATYLDRYIKGTSAGPAMEQPPPPITAAAETPTVMVEEPQESPEPAPPSSSTAVSPVDPSSKFISVQRYQPKQDDEVGFDKDLMVVVKERRLDGWWKVCIDNKEGWAPGTCFQEIKTRIRSGTRGRPQSIIQARRSGFKRRPQSILLDPNQTVKDAPPRRNTISMKKPSAVDRSMSIKILIPPPPEKKK